MSDEVEDICKYGTPFEPLDEDELPRVKPVSIEEQYALDESGRRRFHGAFTGGFSAGFCNTVGSLEGWTPSSFKSSRTNKAESRFQKPEDYMDTEDREEWGIAPKRLQATNDYSENTQKRKRFIGPSSVIPGDPILHSLLVPPSNNIGARLLKSLGWREGQGTGPRKTAMNKNQEQTDTEEEQNSTILMNVSYGPNDCGQFEYVAKLDTFGMGYSGLDRKIFNKPFSLFEPATLNIIDKNKKLSISGQAFGVGTFEDEDEDIYHREDMTQYDFTLEDAKKMQAKKKPVAPTSAHHKCIEGFSKATNPQVKIKTYLLPDIPRNYIPTCGRRTRFEPAMRATQNNEQSKRNENYLRKGLGRHDLDPNTRRQIMQDNNAKVLQNPSEDNEKRELLLQAANITSKLGAVTTFKPFAADPEKEKRYNCFLSFNKESRLSKLRLLQPLNMTEWERDREFREFEQAARLYKPLEGLMSDRFVSGGLGTEDQMQRNSLQAEEEAARSKMFGKLTRKIESWQPVSLLCKRFNVPEPPGGCAPMDELDKKSTNYSVFDYAETSLHHRKNYENENKRCENIKQMDISSNNLEISSDINSETLIQINRPSLLQKHDRTEEKPNRKVSEFEKKIEANLSTNLPENKNLFKLIFADSSDSEEELNQTDKSKETMNEMKSFLLSNENVNSKISNIHCEEIFKQVSISGEQQTTKLNVKKSSPSGIFANIDLDLLKNGGKKIIFQAPSKNEQLKLNNEKNSKSLSKNVTSNSLEKNARNKNRMQESSTNSEFESKEKKGKEMVKETIEFGILDKQSLNSMNNISDFTTSTCSNLNSLETGQRKFIFNAPSKTKQLDLNTFSTTKISTIKNELLQSLQSETKNENLLTEDLTNITKQKKNHIKSKKKKSKNKHKSKDKKKKTKKSKKDKREKKEA